MNATIRAGRPLMACVVLACVVPAGLWATLPGVAGADVVVPPATPGPSPPLHPTPWSPSPVSSPAPTPTASPPSDSQADDTPTGTLAVAGGVVAAVAAASVYALRRSANAPTDEGQR